MPTYQYTCIDCGEPLEVVQSFSDDALTVCPACEGRLRKVFSAVGVVFKGSGFYRTDSRNGASTNGSSSKKSEPNGSSSGSGSSGGSESKDSSSTSASSNDSSSSSSSSSSKAATPSAA